MQTRFPHTTLRSNGAWPLAVGSPPSPTGDAPATSTTITAKTSPTSTTNHSHKRCPSHAHDNNSKNESHFHHQPLPQAMPQPLPLDPSAGHIASIPATIRSHALLPSAEVMESPAKLRKHLIELMAIIVYLIEISSVGSMPTFYFSTFINLIHIKSPCNFLDNMQLSIN